MKNKTFRAALDAFRESISSLQESLDAINALSTDDKYYDIFYDAAVKRFEIAFEYCWKLMKAAVEYEGGEAFGPRPAIQESVRLGWIDDPEFWADALDARNGSVHDYFGISRTNYIKIMKKFIRKSEELAAKIEDAGKKVIKSA